jgi:hypothetical protein
MSLLSNFAFSFNLRRYAEAELEKLGQKFRVALRVAKVRHSLHSTSFLLRSQARHGVLLGNVFELSSHFVPWGIPQTHYTVFSLCAESCSPHTTRPTGSLCKKKCLWVVNSGNIM